LTPEQSEYVKVLQSAGNALLGLINDILDLSKIEAGCLELEYIDFDFHDLIENTIKIMSIRTGSKGLALQYTIAPDVSRHLNGDQGRLRQVLINLIGNAVKFTATGGISLTVERDVNSEADGFLRFNVADTGIGIPPEKQQTIFEKFSQADSSTTRKYGGTGLGLAICKRLVEMMDGRIWIESEEGRGSNFIFTARFGQGAEPKPSAASPGAETEPASAAEVETPLDILLVDDTPQNRILIISFMKKTPHRIDIAENGQIAVEKFKAKSYDIVLMDVQMPVMDGYAATGEIRKWEAAQGANRTPIIALTANAMHEDIQKSIDAGCDTHLTKPIKKQKLFDTIGNYARR
jgi:CheY-like chemotaxis protein